MFGLPVDVRGCLFDLDGVLTQTAKVHGTAWKEMFDGYLREHAQQTGQPFVAFGAADYEEYVGQAEALKEHGADIVVADLAELMEHQ